MGSRKAQRVRNQPRHSDFVSQRRKHERMIDTMRRDLGTAEGEHVKILKENARVHTLIKLGHLRLVRILPGKAG